MPTRSKPFLKRPWVWGVAAALVVGVGIGNASGGSDEAASGEAAATSTSTSRSAASSSSAVPAPSVVPQAVAPTTPPTAPPPPPSTTTPAPPAVDFTMPALVGLDLQTAQNTVQTFGVFFSRSHDLLGSRTQVVDSNWLVCTQNVPPGQQVTGDVEGLIDLGVVKREESCP